jgi:hypothetical protein
MPLFEFTALGIPQAARRFTRMGAAAIDIAPVWEEIIQFFFYIEDTTFQSQGRHNDGSWAELSADWLAQKARLAWDPRINFATWALYDSMTQLGAEGQRIVAGPTTLEIGSDLPEAAPSQAHRPFIKLTAQDRFTMAELIGHYFLEAWEA